MDGTWSVVTDGTYVYKDTYDLGNCWSYAGSSAWTDYIAEAKVKPLSFNGTGNRFSAVFARYANNGNDYYALALQDSNTLVLRKRVGGSSSILTSKTYTINTGTWYTLKLAVDGSSLSGYVNGNLELTTTDSSRVSGCVAVGMYKATAEFDDVVVTNP